MDVPEYVTLEEVRKYCKALNIRDWTQLAEPKVLPQEAKIILDIVNREGLGIALDDFKAGLEVELEHGLMFDDANVTNNHPVLTGKIVLAHFKESLDYYKRLEVAELEGDLVKALVADNLEKVRKLHSKLASARLALSQSDVEQLT